MKDINNIYDVVIIGGGPAGLTAALYLARARYRVLVVEKSSFGGQITITDEVVNYPGIGRTSGAALTETMRKQAQSFGAEFLLAEVEGLDMEGDIKTVKTGRGELKCFGVLLATGAHPRSVGFKGEEDFKGRGIAYCATCDGEFFTDKEVFVVGGGFAAAEESVFLTKYAKHVTVLVRHGDFSCAKATADVTKNHEKITVLTNTEVEEVSGQNTVTYLRYRNNKTGQVTEVKAEGEDFGVFVFAGYAPETGLVKHLAEVNEQGYIVTDEAQRSNVDGLYAAGDVCVKPLRQVVTAAGDGALAATELEKYVAALHAKTGIKPEVPNSKSEELQNRPSNDMEHATKQDSIFDDDMLAQLNGVFQKMESNLKLELYLDDTSVSKDLIMYINELVKLTDRLTVEEAPPGKQVVHLPCVRVNREDGIWTGLAFHGVPGGHEFTSFVLGLYNAAGQGQSLDKDVEEGVEAIKEPLRIQVLVSLTCTMCPETVVSAQKIASRNPLVTAEIYDVSKYEDLRKKYNVNSVPCLVINEEKVSFGKKNIRQLLEIIQ